MPTVWLAESLARRMISANACCSSCGRTAGHFFFGGFRDGGLRQEKVAAAFGQFVERAGSQFHAFVFEQAPHQFSTRVFRFAVGFRFHLRQQQARLDFDQHGGHEQVFGRQFQFPFADALYIVQVLQGELCHRDIQNIEILSPYQIEQQVERTFKGFQKDFQRFGRYVEVVRDFGDGFAVQAGDGVRHTFRFGGRCGDFCR